LGGVARRATLIRQQQQRSGTTLVLDVGNSLLYDRHPAKATKGQSTIEAYNLMGYQAMTLGKLDLTYLTPDEIRQRMGEAHFPIISANAYITGTQERIAQPYAILDVPNHKVGLVGLTEPLNNSNFYVTDPVEAAKSILPEVQRQADIIILLSRAGQEANRRLAEEVKGIDVILCGTNDVLDKPLVIESTGTVLLHADWTQLGHAGERVGVGYLYFDKRGKLVHYEWWRVELDNSYADDPTMRQWLEAKGW